MKANVKYILKTINYGKLQKFGSSSLELQRKISNSADPLVDRLGRRHTYLRISLTERCNLRCQYCMPVEGAPLSPKDELLTVDETLRAAAALSRIGVTKVRLTGGEPTLRKDLPDIIENIATLPNIESVSITTNGLTLLRRLVSYQRAGLSGINVSLDSLQKERYEFIARRAGLNRVLGGIDLALQLGYRPLKINTVLIRGFNDDEVCDFVEMTRDKDVEIRFIEFMPFSGNSWDATRMVSHDEVLDIIRKRYPDISPVMTRRNNTAQLYKIPGHKGQVGLISSMTRPFCGGCDRIRLTADGSLKVCLFGSSEISLRPLLRAGADDSEIAAAVKSALAHKKPQHAAATDCRHDRAQQAARSAYGSHRWIETIPYHIPKLQRTQIYQTRLYTTKGPRLTHVDEEGRAKMVDVSTKPITLRKAVAECCVLMNAKTLKLLKENALAKGDALSIAQIAGTQAAKRTPDLIPLCHAVPLNNVKVNVILPKDTNDEIAKVIIQCEAIAEARTGVEMEALTGASLAALALYDMCKAVDKKMRVTDLRVTHKSGGTSGRTYE